MHLFGKNLKKKSHFSGIKLAIQKLTGNSNKIHKKTEQMTFFKWKKR